MSGQTKQHGGKRDGAGRKPLPSSERMVKRAISLPAELVALAQALGNGNLSAGIRKALEAEREQEAVA